MAIEMKTFPDKETWKAHRGKIGGSDAGAIMGLCKWRDNHTLWREKCGIEEPEDISDRPYVQYGIDNEPNIRNMFRLHHPEWKVEYQPDNMWTNTKYPFAHASLDGWITDEIARQGILEIKTTEITSRAKADEWVDRIPDTYYCQLLHYLLVTEFDFAILCAELKVHKADGSSEWRIIERRIERNDVLDDIKALERQEREFWNYVENKTEPPRLLPAI